MADLKVIEGGAGKVRVGPAVRAAGMLFLLVHVGQAIFGGMWAVIAAPKVAAFLEAAQIPHLEIVLGQLLMVNILPLMLALIGVLGPLFGWWIYSRIAPEKQTETGWAIAGLYALFDAVLSTVGLVLSGGQMDAVAWGGMGFLLAIIALIMTLWVMFFMGIGFLVAKLFKATL